MGKKNEIERTGNAKKEVLKSPIIPTGINGIDDLINQLLDNVEVEVSVKSSIGKAKQKIQKMNTGSSRKETAFAKRDRKADYASDIIEMVDNQNYSLQEVSDAVDISYSYAAKLYRENGGKEAKKRNKRK